MNTMLARALFFAVSLAACNDGGSDATPSDGSSGTIATDATSGPGGSGDGPANPSTTAIPTTTGGGGSGDVSTMTPETGEPPASGTGSSDTTSSIGGSESSGASGSTSGGAGLGPYGDCVGEMLPCPEDSFCLLVPGSGVCTPEACARPSDCPEPPPGGNAPVTCLDANDDGVDDCRIACTNGESCPTGMECFSDEICVWS